MCTDVLRVFFPLSLSPVKPFNRKWHTVYRETLELMGGEEVSLSVRCKGLCLRSHVTWHLCNSRWLVIQCRLRRLTTRSLADTYLQQAFDFKGPPARSRALVWDSGEHAIRLPGLLNTQRCVPAVTMGLSGLCHRPSTPDDGGRSVDIWRASVFPPFDFSKASYTAWTAPHS